MECAQINIVGGTGAVSPKTYSIPGIYKSNDPGILVNIYSMTTSSKYTIPGPPLFTCAGGSGGSGPVTTQPEPVVEEVPVPTQPEPVDSGCEAAQWQQCGGQNYSGCTRCAAGFTCKNINQYYHQCS